jgi:hypothetical protein
MLTARGCFRSTSLLLRNSALSPEKHLNAKRPGKTGPFELRTTGAGEGIRTLDPNLGKVVLYP